MAFNRVIEIVIGPQGQTGRLVKDQKMSFEIFKTTEKSVNTAKIKIWNLKPSTVTEIAKVRNKVIVRAGYEDEGINNVFFGDLIRATPLDEGIDKVLDIEAVDGGLGLEERNISISYAPGTQVSVVLNDIFTVLAYPLATTLTPPQREYVNGYAFIGKARDALTEVLAYIGRTWSIQNELLVILAPDEVVTRGALVLTPKTGLIGTPELVNDKSQDQTGEAPPKRYKVKSLMFPQILPGSSLTINSNAVSGTFKVLDATYIGNNREGDHLVNAEVELI